jgi:hypothetical protein
VKSWHKSWLSGSGSLSDCSRSEGSAISLRRLYPRRRAAAEQSKPRDQISVQAHGLQAFANSTVDEKLKLTNDQARDGQSPLAELFRHLSNGRVSYRCLTLAAIRT